MGHTQYDDFSPSRFCDREMMLAKMAETAADPGYLAGFEDA